MTPDSERKGSEQGFFFFGMEGDLENAQSVCLHRHGLLHSALRFNGKGDKFATGRLGLQRHENGKIEFGNFKLKTLTK
jgi:hypothetical protein